jgi:hypothetical protein
VTFFGVNFIVCDIDLDMSTSRFLSTIDDNILDFVFHFFSTCRGGRTFNDKTTQQGKRWHSQSKQHYGNFSGYLFEKENCLQEIQSLKPTSQVN